MALKHGEFSCVLLCGWSRLICGRRWVFIFDGIITIVVALYGYVFFPDTPYNTEAFYLTASEKARCVERLVEDGREETSKFSWDLFKRAFQSWQLYVLTILWMFWNTTVGKVANTVAQLFLKNDPDHEWSLYQVSTPLQKVDAIANTTRSTTSRRRSTVSISSAFWLSTST